jgi:hypothetical protein
MNALFWFEAAKIQPSPGMRALFIPVFKNRLVARK